MVLLDMLRLRGACFFADLVRDSALLKLQVEQAHYPQVIHLESPGQPLLPPLLPLPSLAMLLHQEPSFICLVFALVMLSI